MHAFFTTRQYRIEIYAMSMNSGNQSRLFIPEKDAEKEAERERDAIEITIQNRGSKWPKIRMHSSIRTKTLFKSVYLVGFVAP